MVRVVVGALVRDGRVLLVHRRPDKHAFPDVWDLPGGVLEAGEPERAALGRELGEELGIEVATGAATHLRRVAAGPDDEPVDLSVWSVPQWGGEPANVAPEEHDDLAWFDLDDLPPPADRGPALAAALPHLWC
jgi:mutator protein MutT